MPLIPFPPLELVLPLVDAALAEDVGSGDATTTAAVDPAVTGEGAIRVGAEGVICGLPVAREVFYRVDSALVFETDVEEGQFVAPGTTVARVRGPVRGILTAERTALNFVQHLSGIATSVHAMVRALAGTGTRVLDTRKTVPGMRLLSKYAVKCGGGENHRRGLFDMILIKENHIIAAGGIRKAVGECRAQYPDLTVEVEVTSLDELVEALAAAPDRVLLDNFAPDEVAASVERVRKWCREKGEKAPEIEVSGGVDTSNVLEYAREGVDFVSSGAITHSAPALDMSLELEILSRPKERARGKEART